MEATIFNSGEKRKMPKLEKLLWDWREKGTLKKYVENEVYRQF